MEMMEKEFKDFEKWKEFLGKRVKTAKKVGISENVITEFAEEIGEFLSNKIDPRNHQERVLSDMWSVANDQEKHAIAHMMVKLSENESD